ncbi:MAG: hypothetical protein LBF87_04405 [Treponema sp.]|nr:hypothetical protein [Treponema sp.]
MPSNDLASSPKAIGFTALSVNNTNHQYECLRRVMETRAILKTKGGSRGNFVADPSLQPRVARKRA